MKNRGQKRTSHLPFALACILLLAVFCFALTNWLRDQQSAQREKSAFDSLYAIVERSRAEQEGRPLEKNGHQKTEQTLGLNEAPSISEATEQKVGSEEILEEDYVSSEVSVEHKTQAPSETVNEAPAVETVELPTDTARPTPTENATPEAFAVEMAEPTVGDVQQMPVKEASSEAATVENAIEMQEKSEAFILPQYLQLYEMNEDFFGWISIDESNINYPVMYTPNRPEYYIHRAFDGSESSGGVPFIDGRCVADGNYYLVYGHNMKNKTMFGDLPEYARREFYEEHPIIRYDTLYEEREYRVIAAFYSQISAGDATNAFRYYDYFDLRDEAVFDEYIRQIRKASLYDTGFESEYGDELLALSTCSYHTTNGRFVVVAKRVMTT